jgi:hypothetical protein
MIKVGRFQSAFVSLVVWPIFFGTPNDDVVCFVSNFMCGSGTFDYKFTSETREIDSAKRMWRRYEKESMGTRLMPSHFGNPAVSTSAFSLAFSKSSSEIPPRVKESPAVSRRRKEDNWEVTWEISSTSGVLAELDWVGGAKTASFPGPMSAKGLLFLWNSGLIGV